MEAIWEKINPRKLIKWYGIFFVGSITAWKSAQIYMRNYGEQWEEHLRPRSQLQEVAENRLWRVAGTFYGVPHLRNMFIYRMENGNLMLYSPMVLSDSEMSDIEGLGTPEVVLIPNAAAVSTVDAALYKKRYPNLKYIAPAEARTEIEKKVPIDETTEDFFSSRPDLMIGVITPPLQAFHENMYDIPLDAGERALLAGQLISNMKTTWGVRSKLLWLMGFGTDGEQPDIPAVMRIKGMKSLDHMRHFFRRLSEETEKRKYVYKYICSQYGNPVTNDIHKKLKKLSDAY